MLTTKSRTATLVVTCLGLFMLLLDTTIVYIATPSILSALRASLDDVLWVLNGYLLTYAVLLITAGRLADLFGPRNLFVVGLLVFTVASALCGLAQDASQLIAARVLQGLGGAVMAPQALTLLTAAFPPEKRGAAFGINGAVVGLSTVAGPTLGGLITTYADWRGIFFLNVPIGLITVVIALVVVPDLRLGGRPRLDLIGVALGSLAILGLVFGLIEGQRYDWSMGIWALLAASVLLLVIFGLWEARQTEPLIPLGLFRNRNFALTNITGASMQFAMQGVFLPLTIYLQSVLALTALAAGFVVAPLALAATVVAPVAGQVADRVGGKYLLMAGLAIFGAGAAWVVAIARSDSAATDFIVPLAFTGAGLGLVFAPQTTLAMSAISARSAAAASGVFNTTQQIGSVLGAAVIGAVLQNRLALELASGARAAAPQLPGPYQQQFIDTFAEAARAGLQVGRGQTGAGQSLVGLPPDVAQQVGQLVHDVFVNGYIAAMQPTVLVAVGVLLLASLCCLLLRSMPGHQASPELVGASAGHTPA